jgi:hypothetical protein
VAKKNAATDTSQAQKPTNPGPHLPTAEELPESASRRETASSQFGFREPPPELRPRPAAQSSSARIANT